MVLGPVDHPFDLRPVGNIAEIDQSQRRTGNDQTIEVLVLDVFKVAVEVVQMLGWRVLRFAAIDTQQLDIDLQRRVDNRRRNWFSVSIFFGIRLRISTFSGLISCVFAREDVITKTFSPRKKLTAGNSSGTRIGIA